MANPIVETMRTRLQQNLSTNVFKNIAEEAAEAIAKYIAGYPLVQDFNRSLHRIFGGAVSEWMGKGAGILGATVIGAPDFLVSITQSVLGKDRAAAQHIVSEMVDEFLRTLGNCVALQMPVEEAMQVAFEDVVDPFLSNLKDGMDSVSGIVYKDPIGIVSTHSLNCDKMYEPGGGVRPGIPPEYLKDIGPRDILVKGARIQSFKQMAEAGIDVSVSGCGCKGLSTEFKQFQQQLQSQSQSRGGQKLVEDAKPKTFAQCRMLLRFHGGTQDQELERRFITSLRRLRNDCHPALLEDLKLLEGTLNRKDWTLDKARMAIQDWDPQELDTIAELLKKAATAFHAEETIVDKVLSAGKAVYTGNDAKGRLAQVKTFFAEERSDAQKRIDDADREMRARRALGFK